MSKFSEFNRRGNNRTLYVRIIETGVRINKVKTQLVLQLIETTNTGNQKAEQGTLQSKVKEISKFCATKVILESKSQFINCPSLQIKSFIDMNTVCCCQGYYKV